jgi:cyclase
MRRLQEDGVGEVVVNSIDRDGTQEGFDLALVAQASALATVPLTVMGGAGSLQHLKDAFAVGGVSGAAAGSFFVFKGRFRAVLISYPSRSARENLRVGEGPT